MKIDFEHEFPERILKRGYEYYKNGYVENISIQEDLITADIIGTKTYKAYIEIEDDILLDAGCSCPYASDGIYCKHIAALLYHINDEDINKVNTNNSKNQDLYSIIKQIDKTKLEKFLVELLSKDKNVYDEFRLKFNNLFPKLTLDEYKGRINEAIITSAGRDGFIDYYESWDYTREMYKITNEADTLVDNGNYELAFDIVSSILDTIPNTDIDDSNGSTGEVAETCIEIIKRILEYVLTKKDKLAKKILEYIIDELRTEYLSNYGIELYELLNDYIEQKVYIKEIKLGLINILEMSKTRNFFWKTKYYIDILLNIYNLENSHENIMNLLIEYSDDQDVCLKLVEEYIKQKDIKKAINLLEKNLKETGNTIYAEKLSEIYSTEGMIKEYRDILYKLLYELDKYNIIVYKKIKELYSKKDWVLERENIINKALTEVNWYFRNIIKIYTEEKMYDDIYSLIKNKNINTIMEYEKYLLPKYNKELINIYVEYCKKFAKTANNRKLYRELAGYLRHIKYMENSKEEYINLMEEIKQQYRNKPAMQDELKRL